MNNLLVEEVLSKTKISSSSNKLYKELCKYTDASERKLMFALFAQKGYGLSEIAKELMNYLPVLSNYNKGAGVTEDDVVELIMKNPRECKWLSLGNNDCIELIKLHIRDIAMSSEDIDDIAKALQLLGLNVSSEELNKYSLVGRDYSTYLAASSKNMLTSSEIDVNDNEIVVIEE